MSLAGVIIARRRGIGGAVSFSLGMREPHGVTRDDFHETLERSTFARPGSPRLPLHCGAGMQDERVMGAPR